MNDDKNCGCDGLANAIWGPIALVGLIVHPFLSIAVLILWAMGTAWAARPYRAPQPWALLSPAQRLEQAYLATGREPPPVGVRDLASERRQVLKVITWTFIGGVVYFAIMLAITPTGGLPHPAP